MLRAATARRRKGPWHDAGALFAWAALALATAAQLYSGMAPLVVGLALFAAGLAHGAGEEEDGTIRAFGAIHVAAYLLVGAAVAALFLAAPLAGLALFLALSAWHFAHSDGSFGPHARTAIAALAVGGSALLRPRGTRRVFELATGGEVPPEFVTLLGVAGAVGLALAALALWKNQRGCGEAAIAAGAVLLFDPVLAVGTIFLVGHAIPVQRRQIARYGARAVWRAVALPTLVATGGALALALAVTFGWLPLGIAVALAFGLATPHMLTERLER